MGGSEPVRRDYFDLYKDGIRRELDDLKETVKRLQSEHDADMDDLAKAEKDRRTARKGDRQWTWGQVVQVVVAAAAVATVWLAVIAR